MNKKNEIIRKHLNCTCDEMYKTRNMVDPTCTLCEYEAEIELMMDEYLKTQNNILYKIEDFFSDSIKNKNINHFVKLYGTSEENKSYANSFAVGYSKAWDMMVAELLKNNNDNKLQQVKILWDFCDYLEKTTNIKPFIYKDKIINTFLDGK